MKKAQKYTKLRNRMLLISDIRIVFSETVELPSNNKFSTFRLIYWIIRLCSYRTIWFNNSLRIYSSLNQTQTQIKNIANTFWLKLRYRPLQKQKNHIFFVEIEQKYLRELALRSFLQLYREDRELIRKQYFSKIERQATNVL